VQLAGRPLVAFPLPAARAAGLEAVVVAKRSSQLPPLDCEVVHAPELPRHPLCGILAALDRGAERPVVAIACDMPFLEPALLLWLANLDGPAVGHVNGRIEPLLARYVSADRGELERAIREHAPLTRAVTSARLLDERALSRFGDPQRLCFSVNDAADLAWAARALSSSA
jgi:molybdopterin-guanine dinucleotide biosynthesis protein A